MSTISNLEDFIALDPFFRIIERGLEGIAGPGHFFDLLAEDIIVDYVITVPGYPRRVHGREAVADLYRPYGNLIVLDRCFDLAVHHDTNDGVVVLEYASEGHTVQARRPYNNRYISVLTIADGTIIHWRDYLDPIAVFDAVGWPT
jgi:ketosteroid isomerase-like protein